MDGYIAYAVFFLTVASIYGLVCLGLNLQWGSTGLFNVGVAGFGCGASTGKLNRLAVVTGVDPNSAAADKRLQPGDVIVEIGQQPVSTPSDVAKQLEALKKDGKKSALLYVSNAQGDMRYVAVAME